MKILLFGKTGALGSELECALAALGELTAPDRAKADLEDLPALSAAVRAAAPDVIVNAAAYTNVDKAESDADRAHCVNAEAVAAIAEEAARCGAWLVHYSTDYVFDGAQTRAYVEDDPARPLSVYGRTKLEGEEAIRARNARHLIFRTSWLYGARGKSFPRKILDLATSRDELAVVADQHGAPTSAKLVAEATIRALARVSESAAAQALAGTYHVAAAGETTWCEYARFVLAEARRHGAALKTGPERVRPIATADYPLPAARPKNSRLDTTKLRVTFGVEAPDWRVGVVRLLDRHETPQHA